jgi:hypothetical protein
MQTIQLAIGDRSYATALREMLLRNGNWDVFCVEAPNPGLGGVVVLDRISLEGRAMSLVDPERVVLITRNNPEDLSRAWEAGIVSLVFESDPIHTAMLAVMAASMRVAKDARKPSKTPALGPEPNCGKAPDASLRKEPAPETRNDAPYGGGNRR